MLTGKPLFISLDWPIITAILPLLEFFQLIFPLAGDPENVPLTGPAEDYHYADGCPHPHHVELPLIVYPMTASQDAPG